MGTFRRVFTGESEKDPLFNDDEEEKEFTRRTSGSFRHCAGGGGFSSHHSNILSMSELSPKVQRHICQVYRNLAATAGCAALACFMHIHDLLPSLDGAGFLFSFLLLLMISMSYKRISDRWRFAMLLSFGFLQGWDIGSIVHEFYAFDHEALTMALVATAIAFVTFSGTALFSPRRSYLYFGGLLGTLTLVSFIGSFFRGFFSANLYLGLFILCFYIIYDTQVIVERAESGYWDEIGSTVSLFTDLLGIFVRLLLILNRQSKRQSKRRRSMSRR